MSPGAAIGSCPSPQPRAVGIFKVGIAPCGFASGIAGAAPHAATCGTPCILRNVQRDAADDSDDFRKHIGKAHGTLALVFEMHSSEHSHAANDSSFTIYRRRYRIGKNPFSA